ncbi:hypothetical protein [Streptomyces poriticola]|uniref:hypothetical protein n=1 Tax=Streptomyces poriticola TaxID=3120506 RepID=UPI002FCE538C
MPLGQSGHVGQLRRRASRLPTVDFPDADPPITITTVTVDASGSTAEIVGAALRALGRPVP